MKKQVYTLLVLSFAFSIIADFVSCSPVKFAVEQEPAKAYGPNIVMPVSCSSGLCLQHHSDTKIAGPGKADIIFILDNGGSVADVQGRIAAQFSNFLNSISTIDYRIGIMTTDISSQISDTPYNLNGNPALQDGRLVKLTNGQYFITPQTPDPQGTFAANIHRPETDVCLANNYQDSHCPSQDPRGIYAANLMVNSNYQNFLRPNVQTTFVIISDDDERNSTDLSKYGYPQGANDSPATLISNFASHFPGKKLKVSALVIKPGDIACYNDRYGRNGNPDLFGHYANIYASLVSQTGGVLGSICSNDFTAELGAIATGMDGSEQVTSADFVCQPYKNKYQIKFLNTDGSNAPATTVTPDFSNRKLQFASPLPANVKAVIDYDCQV